MVPLARDQLLRQEKDEASPANGFRRIVEFEPSFSDLRGVEAFAFRPALVSKIKTPRAACGSGK